MARNYAVVLDAPTTGAHFARGYFPRGFHYKKEADDLVKEVEEKGGKAHVVPKAQFTPILLRRLKGE